MANPKRIYWDACIWIDLINGVEPWAAICKELIGLAERGEVQIWTSSFTLAEVYKTKCNGQTVGIESERDSNFEEFIQQDFLIEVQLDHDIGVRARRLLRQHSQLKKAGDAIHLATAVAHNLDELHTTDDDNLIPLNGSINRADGENLRICHPEAPPPDDASDDSEGNDPQIDLLSQVDK